MLILSDIALCSNHNTNNETAALPNDILILVKANLLTMRSHSRFKKAKAASLAAN